MNVPARKNLLTSADELASDLGDSGLRIIDCRFELLDPAAGRKAWLEAHIPGAVYADLDRDLSGPVTPDSGRHPLPGVESATGTFSRLGVDAHTRVVVYDDAGGAIAARAWWLLRWLGHRQVTVLDGGLAAWRARDLPLESGPCEAPRRTFTAGAGQARMVSTAAIAAHADRRLVDARDAARFRGESEPIDARAGHIPGSKNLPFVDCLNADGTWQDADTLRARLEPLLGGEQDAAWAVMCGSGVTACHLVISGLLAGYSEPAVYVGSWSEWIRDPSRPVATGDTQ